jgi:hypothetical protein
MNGILRGRSLGLAWGFSLGAALVLYWAWRQMRPRDEFAGNRMLDPETIRTIAAGTLLADPSLRRYDLQVRAIAPGILDLSGTVASSEQAERALACVRKAPGVRTVLNRLDVAAELEELNS